MSSLVSTIIPTYNRLSDVVLAVRAARAQTHRHQEIIVIDDGSTDGTGSALRAEHGEAIRVLSTNRLGVSGARNRGMAESKGDYIAFLDSDDDWLPEKLARQVAYLEQRPDFGIVVTDVVQMDAQRRDYDVLRRRSQIPEDGDALRTILRFPSLAPSSALIRRKVYEDLHGFDTSLPTAEDIDFLLRAALTYKVGLIEEPLTRAMRGHDGLSALSRTYSDYLYVMERYLLDHRDEIPTEDRKAALRAAYLRNMRGLLVSGQISEGLAVGARLASKGKTSADVMGPLRLLPLAARLAVRKIIPGK